MRHAQTTYKFYSDPGHGWLMVQIAELEELEIADQVSAYSYQSGPYAFLEEDSDAGLFSKAKTDAMIIDRRHTDGDSFVRQLQPWGLPTEGGAGIIARLMAAIETPDDLTPGDIFDLLVDAEGELVRRRVNWHRAS